MKNKSTSFKHTVCVCVFDAGEKQSCVHHQMTSNGHQSQFRLVNDLKFRRLRSFLPLATVAMFSIRYFQTHHVAWWPPNNITNNIDSHMFRPDLIPLQLSLSLSSYLLCNKIGRKKREKSTAQESWKVLKCWTLPPNRTALLIFILSYSFGNKMDTCSHRFHGEIEIYELPREMQRVTQTSLVTHFM